MPQVMQGLASHLGKQGGHTEAVIAAAHGVAAVVQLGIPIG